MIEEMKAVVANLRVGDVFTAVYDNDEDYTQFYICHMMKKIDLDYGYRDIGFQLVNLSSNTITDIKGNSIKSMMDDLLGSFHITAIKEVSKLVPTMRG